MKIPECQFCHYKMYVIENRRKAIGYLCPDCNFTSIINPTDYWQEVRKKRLAKINQRSISGTKPKFGYSRIVTICQKCRKSKYVKCRKIKQTKARIKQGLTPLWGCVCTKCDFLWGQSHPKIEMVKMTIVGK